MVIATNTSTATMKKKAEYLQNFQQTWEDCRDGKTVDNIWTQGLSEKGLKEFVLAGQTIYVELEESWKGPVGTFYKEQVLDFIWSIKDMNYTPDERVNWIYICATDPIVGG
jgi:hypothetical protein